MGKRSKTPGETLSASKVTLDELNKFILHLARRFGDRSLNSQLRRDAFRSLIRLEAEREALHGVSAPVRNLPRRSLGDNVPSSGVQAHIECLKEERAKPMASRIMYIEDKSAGLVGACRVGRVTLSKTGATLRYRGRSFQSLKGLGFKANYIDIETGQHFWISGPRKDGADGLYGRITQPEDVDADVAEEYWLKIRGLGHVPSSGLSTVSFGDGEKPEPVHGRKAVRIARTTRARDHT
jgi:hypothetical protein